VLYVDKASKESSATSNGDIKAVLDTFFEYTPLIKVGQFMVFCPNINIFKMTVVFY